MEPNAVGTWELRVRHFREFYDVHLEQNLVRVNAIGRKEGNTLFIRGEEFRL